MDRIAEAVKSAFANNTQVQHNTAELCRLEEF
jgi:hypothetical protein